jgi:small subunit ribosomal protein MRP21
MFRSIIRTSVITPSRVPLLFVSTRFNSSFDQLSKAINQGKPDSENSNSVTDINELLNSSLETPDTSYLNSKSNEYGLGEIVPHPRDVAKNIRIQGPMAGRVVDVNYGNLNRALVNMRHVISQNKIRPLQKLQSRYVRPAKLRKQMKREWWRRKFSAGFKDLMSQVTDARRRGY